MKTLKSILTIVGWLTFVSMALGQEQVLPPAVATVIQAQGSPLAVLNNVTRKLTRQDNIYPLEKIVTGANEKITIKLPDGSLITIADNSEFTIDQFMYQPERQWGEVLLSMTKGAFRVVTGAVGKLANKRFEVKTPVAAIGVRGTDFWGGFYFPDKGDPKKIPLDVIMLEGKGIYIKNAKGITEISEPGKGTTVASSKEAPTPGKTWPDDKVKRAKASIQFDAL